MSLIEPILPCYRCDIVSCWGYAVWLIEGRARFCDEHLRGMMTPIIIDLSTNVTYKYPTKTSSNNNYDKQNKKVKTRSKPYTRTDKIITRSSNPTKIILQK
jgi:hypothetical protein